MPDDKQKKSKKHRKRTWRAPEIKTGSLFESNSLACGKTPQEEMCQQVGIQSS